MSVSVSLYSKKKEEIARFLNDYKKNMYKKKYALEWTKQFENPIEIADIIGVYIDNNYKYNISMWISLDKNFFINITNNNANKIIRYLFERYPY